jgi:hypothetical protein
MPAFKSAPKNVKCKKPRKNVKRTKIRINPLPDCGKSFLPYASFDAKYSKSPEGKVLLRNELTPLPPDTIRSISTPWLKEILAYRRSGSVRWKGGGGETAAGQF